MTYFPIPYPSLRCRGLLWSRSRSAVAVVPSGFLANLAIVATYFSLATSMMTPGVSVELFARWWFVPVILLAVANLVMLSIVTVRPDGVRVRRLGLAFLRVEPVALGGEFSGVDTSPFDDDADDCDDDDLGNLRSIAVYHHRYAGVSVDCLRPAALAMWLTAQAARIAAHHPLPTAILVSARRRARPGRVSAR